MTHAPRALRTLEADCDLTRNKSVLNGFGADYKSQNLGFGLEWNTFLFRALRVGTYKNLAESDLCWVYAAGLWVNFWAARLDITGAFSNTKAQYNGNNIPQETRVAAQLSVDFKQNPANGMAPGCIRGIPFVLLFSSTALPRFPPAESERRSPPLPQSQAPT